MTIVNRQTTAVGTFLVVVGAIIFLIATVGTIVLATTVGDIESYEAGDSTLDAYATVNQWVPVVEGLAGIALGTLTIGFGLFLRAIAPIAGDGPPPTLTAKLLAATQAAPTQAAPTQEPE